MNWTSEDRTINKNITLIIKALCFVLLAAIVSGCTALTSYYPNSDAPESIKNGKTDFRLALTQTFGQPLSPIVRNVALPYGNLRFTEGLDEHLHKTLKPLDIILVRSRPALTRFAIPSHFTHAVIWLGTQAERDALGISDLPEIKAYRKQLAAGKIVYESAGSEVRLNDIRALKNTNEMVIMRPAPMTKERYQQRYAAMFKNLGVGFDTNFDLLDRTKLTCMEITALVFPEFNLPARYTTGRYTLIPDDLAHLAASSNDTISVVHYIKPKADKEFSVLNARALKEVLTEPKRRTRHARSR